MWSRAAMAGCCSSRILFAWRMGMCRLEPCSPCCFWCWIVLSGYGLESGFWVFIRILMQSLNETRSNYIICLSLNPWCGREGRRAKVSEVQQARLHGDASWLQPLLFTDIRLMDKILHHSVIPLFKRENEKVSWCRGCGPSTWTIQPTELQFWCKLKLLFSWTWHKNWFFYVFLIPPDMRFSRVTSNLP